ncbi:MAG: DUF362 domain-containing protein [Desulfobulbus sp.]|jgi:uncharacterized Fe-S center protein
MAVPVYWAKLAVKNPKDNRLAKIRRLCEAVGLAERVKPLFQGGEDDVVAVKMHFGERGNDTYLHPTFVRQVVDCVKGAGARPFLTDTCTLYKAMRHNAVDHLETAYLHGFTPYVVDAPIIIADGVTSRSYEEVVVNLKHFATVKIAQAFLSANAMVVLSHFKGHGFSGFGGAIKNLAMGCAPQEGKIDQHGKSIVIYPGCIGCGQCVEICPRSALSLEPNKKGKGCHAVIDRERCIGCYECVSVCKQGAIGVDLPGEYAEFAERMAEYAYGAARRFQQKDRICYLNFVMNVTPQCDCAGWSDPLLVPDLGILASTDPVAIDQACLDLVRQAPSLVPLAGHEHDHAVGHDKFAALHPKTQGAHQVVYAESIGMGSREYELIPV